MNSIWFETALQAAANGAMLTWATVLFWHAARLRFITLCAGSLIWAAGCAMNLLDLWPMHSYGVPNLLVYSGLAIVSVFWFSNGSLVLELMERIHDHRHRVSS